MYVVMVFAMLAVFGARPIDAACLSPLGGFSPRDGTVLPERAAVYLFVMTQDDDPQPLALEVDGARFTAQRVATVPAYHVIRIVLTASGPEVTIRWRSRSDRTVAVRYPIGVPAPAEARVTGVSRTLHVWSCSRTDLIEVELTSNAIAYRLDWSDGTSAIVPADVTALWRRSPDDGDVVPSHRIPIGQVSCLGHTVEPSDLRMLRELRLVALFADGSSRQLGRARAQLDRQVVRLPWELVPPIARHKPEPADSVP